jgi:long-chain acyl-CoA synthetase
VKAGDAVAIIANNRVDWAVACYATYGRGARFVPMYEVELVKIWKYIVADSGSKVLFVANDAIFEKTKGFVDEIEGLEHIVRIEGSGEGTMAALEEKGRSAPVPSIRPAAGDIAGLIYTSGTTGDPKGVLLSHGNLTSNVHAILKAWESMLDQRTRTLSFLPWAHAYGQIAELHVLTQLGGSTGFAESPQTIVDDLKLVKPTLLVAVPRVFNRVYDKIQATMAEKGGVPKLLFEQGLAAASKTRRLKARKRWPGIIPSVVHFVADKVVFKKIRELFGGELLLAVSSSAALNPDIADFFFSIGIPVYDAWGMTELSPAATVNTPDSFKFGSAGKPIDKVRVVIDKSVVETGATDGEIIVYGPNVMQGYHNKPEATKATLTDDGGMRTGDRGYLDADGFLFITGRIKEQFKLENGKYVFPAAIEEEIKLLPEVEHAMVFGLNKPFTICVVVPDFLVMGKLAKERGLPEDPARLVEHPEVKELLESKIKAHLQGKFAAYEIPKKLLLVSEPFSTENGLLTPTLKLKRRTVLERYGEPIESLYA